MIDKERDNLLTDFGKTTLKDRYLLPEEDSPQEAFMRAAKAFSDNDEMAQRIYDYSSKLWFMFSTPILSNGGTKRGMPISLLFLIMLVIAERELLDIILRTLG